MIIIGPTGWVYIQNHRHTVKVNLENKSHIHDWAGTRPKEPKGIFKHAPIESWNLDF